MARSVWDKLMENLISVRNLPDDAYAQIQQVRVLCGPQAKTFAANCLEIVTETGK